MVEKNDVKPVKMEDVLNKNSSEEASKVISTANNK